MIVDIICNADSILSAAAAGMAEARQDEWETASVSDMETIKAMKERMGEER